MAVVAQNVADFIATFIGQEKHQAQNDVELYYCFAKTMDKYRHLHIVYEADSCTTNGTYIGIMMFKLLMHKANTDTRDTALHLGKNIINLKSYMSMIDSNIELFNQHAKINRASRPVRSPAIT
jgi:hypothetical protein